MEAGSGREAEVTVAEAVNDDSRHDDVERRPPTKPMTDDRAWRRGAHNHRDSRVQPRPSSEMAA
jgi:hypothetical protein